MWCLGEKQPVNPDQKFTTVHDDRRFPAAWRCAIIRGLLLSSILVYALATPSFAADQQGERRGGSFSVRWENDAVGGTDANYTNGISMALTRKGKGLLGGVWDLAGSTEGERFATYELTQLQFTPSNLELNNPDPADRPYAGLLYLGCTTHLQRDDSLHSLKIMAGVAGPGSYAEGLQRFTHRVLGYNLPQGWDFQLKNEPVVNLIYEYRHKYRITPRDAAITVELIPMGRAFLGNYLIQADAEVQCRIGYHSG